MSIVVFCVAYDVHGLRDSIKNGETGLLVENAKVKALSNGIVKLLEDEEVREELSEKALNYARQFTWNKSARDFLKVLQQT